MCLVFDIELIIISLLGISNEGKSCESFFASAFCWTWALDGLILVLINKIITTPFRLSMKTKMYEWSIWWYQQSYMIWPTLWLIDRVFLSPDDWEGLFDYYVIVVIEIVCQKWKEKENGYRWMNLYGNGTIVIVFLQFFLMFIHVLFLFVLFVSDSQLPVIWYLVICMCVFI